MRLIDKVAIITGGAEGIGKAFAQGFAREGAKVVIADINISAANSLVNVLEREGAAGALAVQVDVSQRAEVDEMVKRTIDRFGKIDILVNNAAVYIRNAATEAPVWEIDPSHWEKVIAVNITGVFLCCRAVLPYMIKQKGGKVINIASSLAFKARSNYAHYVTSKGGVVSFTRAVARDVGEYNINVNAIAPGSTLSEDDASAKVMERRTGEIASRALKRIEKPADLVGTAIFLASSDSDFITGQTILVDGGSYMH
jgi:3-oxoacyl-[acyl-carrier protein] reductase